MHLVPAARRRALRSHLPAALAALLAGSIAVGAEADDATQAVSLPEPHASYVLGLSVARQPEYEGGQRYVYKPRPLWAWQRGRYRISTSGAGAVLGFGATAPEIGAGASAELLHDERLRIGAALRIDNGRRSSTSADLAGLPDVRRTLRGRMFASYAISEHWGAAASLSQDLLGHQGGALASFDLGYHLRLGAHTEGSAGVGLRLGDHRYLATRYGITPESALQTGKPAYDPGAGVETLTAGIGITSALTPSWIAFAALSADSLRGDAAASPLTRARTGHAAAVGLAWRCCR